MRTLELIEIDPLDGGVGYGGEYGGAGSLILVEETPPKTTAKTGELWMSFLNDPSKKPFKVQDVAAGQKVQVPSLPDAPVRFYLISNDPSGRKTVINLNAARVLDVNVNKENKTPVIEQLGQSTLDKIQIGIKNYLETARYRRIQISTTANFAPGTFVDYAIRDFDGIVKVIGALEIIERTYSATEATRWIRLAHSTNGINYSPWSNYLPITFRNDPNEGVPTLSDAGAIVRLFSETNYEIEVPLPVANAFDLRELQLRWLDAANFTYADGNHPSASNFIQVKNISSFSSEGGRAVVENGETFNYTGTFVASDGIKGTLLGVTRGIEDTAAQSIPDNTIIRGLVDIKLIYNPSNIQQCLRLMGDTILQHRWRNNFYLDGRNGLAEWKYLATIAGRVSVPTPVPYEPPPPPIENPEPAPGGEDPYNPINEKRRDQRINPILVM